MGLKAFSDIHPIENQVDHDEQALGIVSAVKWMIENPRKGLCTPEDLPHDFVLKISLPYLGKFVSVPSHWTPLKNRKVYFKENPANHHDSDMWQFSNFHFNP